MPRSALPCNIPVPGPAHGVARGRNLKPAYARVDTRHMDRAVDCFALSLTALIAEVLAEHSDDGAVRPLTTLLGPKPGIEPGVAAGAADFHFPQGG